MLVDSNYEYEFHPEIYSALRRIDKKIYLIHYFCFFLKYLLQIHEDIFRDFEKKNLIQDINTKNEIQFREGFRLNATDSKC